MIVKNIELTAAVFSDIFKGNVVINLHIGIFKDDADIVILFCDFRNHVLLTFLNQNLATWLYTKLRIIIL